jgi:hypothetical protein
MINRREVVQSGIAATLLSAAPAFTMDRGSLPLYKIVYDARFPEAASFADEGRRAGVSAAAFSGDVTGVWFHDLDGRWKAGPAPVAGLTDHASWFVLDMMARGAGLRTVYLAHHGLSSAGCRHAVFGPPEGVRHQAAFDAAREGWSRAAARAVLTFPAEVRVDRPHSLVADAYDHLPEPGGLVSWIIAAPSPSGGGRRAA